MTRRLSLFIHTKPDLEHDTLMAAMDGHPQELASVLSLSLHRLQRAPRAMHRAFLARPSIFRLLLNVKGLYRAERTAFLGHRGHVEISLSHLIAQAQESILIISDGDFIGAAMVGAIEREKPTLKIRRISAVHGERIVIVDDGIVFLGAGDMGVVVKGELARAVSDCFQLTMHRSQLCFRSAWPLLTRVDIDGVDVAISRTWLSKDLAPVIENERLALSAIRSARRFIYIETKALTSPVLVNALAWRLRKENSPEIVVMLSKKTTATLGLLQKAALARIQKADLFDRFRAYVVDQNVNGLLIVDDQLVKIGTSQWTSQSLGASRALDLSVEAIGRPMVVMAIAKLRRERIGEWLRLDPSEFDARFLLNGSLTGTIESFFTPQRRLEQLEVEATPMMQFAFSLAPLLDPKRHQGLKRWILHKARFGTGTWRFALILATMFALLAIFSTLFAPVHL